MFFVLVYIVICVILMENVNAWIVISDFVMHLFMRTWDKYLFLQQLSFAFSIKR